MIGMFFVESTIHSILSVFLGKSGIIMLVMEILGLCSIRILTIALKVRFVRFSFGGGLLRQF